MNVPIYVSLQFMFGCLSVSFRTIKEKKTSLFLIIYSQCARTNKNMKNDKLPRMFTAKTRIRLYRCTIESLFLSSQHTMSDHYRLASGTAFKCRFACGPIVAFVHKDSDQTAQLLGNWHRAIIVFYIKKIALRTVL